MTTLRIELFGAPRLSWDSTPLPPFPTERATSLFSFLVIHRGHLYGRDTLAGTFRGEHPDAVARKYLRTDLWRIRDTLRRASEAASRCLLVRHQLVGFDATADYWLDLQEFERRVDEADRLHRKGSVDAGPCLEVAIQLYRGDLLQGLCDDWCFHEQERYRALFLRALEQAMTYHAGQGNCSKAVEFGRRLLENDPLRESVHREVMRLLYRAGDRPAALRQFATCAGILRKELDVEPMGETVTLHRSILAERAIGEEPRNGRATPVPARVVAIPAVELREAAAEVRLAQTHLESALRRIEPPKERDRDPPP